MRIGDQTARRLKLCLRPDGFSASLAVRFLTHQEPPPTCPNFAMLSRREAAQRPGSGPSRTLPGSGLMAAWQGSSSTWWTASNCVSVNVLTNLPENVSTQLRFKRGGEIGAGINRSVPRDSLSWRKPCGANSASVELRTGLPKERVCYEC
jgi:hypothetical protein